MNAIYRHRPKRHNNHTVVIGLGVSGLSAVNYLHAHQIPVTVVDMNRPPLADKLPDGIKSDFGRIDSDILQTAELIVISPGVDPSHDSIVQARQRGIPIISDVQLFIDECHAKGIKIVAITGSNAKSTVTTLVGQMAKDAGQKVGVGGNIGVPALDLLADDIALAVLELSSFQLEGIDTLCADVATILNLSADHLDRHGDMTNYLNVKLGILNKAKNIIVGRDDGDLYHACMAYIANYSQCAKLATISSHDNTADFYIQQTPSQITLQQGDHTLITHDKLWLKGKHNLTNALFALAIGQALGFEMAGMLSTLQRFEGLAHRCQFVKTIAQKDYFNDSKGTNVGATLAAIDGLGQVYGKESLAVILGGQAKGQSFGELAFLLDDYADSIYLIGQDAHKIQNDLVGLSVPIVNCDTLANAVQQASQSCAKAVLLSPACASFDQFAGFAHRGECFVGLVSSLATAD